MTTTDPIHHPEPVDATRPRDTYGIHFVGQSSPSWNMLGWVRPDEHPGGLLGVPCPECGYRYGSEWKVEEVPTGVVVALRAITAGGRELPITSGERVAS